jgi:hypothetical protein
MLALPLHKTWPGLPPSGPRHYPLMPIKIFARSRKSLCSGLMRVPVDSWKLADTPPSQSISYKRYPLESSRYPTSNSSYHHVYPACVHISHTTCIARLPIWSCSPSSHGGAPTAQSAETPCNRISGTRKFPREPPRPEVPWEPRQVD